MMNNIYHRGYSDCAKVPMAAHQVLPLTGYLCEVSNGAPATGVNRIYSMDKSKLGNLWAGIGSLMYSTTVIANEGCSGN